MNQQNFHAGEGTNISFSQKTTHFGGGNINDPNRSNGIAYLGFGPLKIGWDSEDIRHFIQNRVAHDGMSAVPQYGNQYAWILALDRRPRLVFQFGNF